MGERRDYTLPPKDPLPPPFSKGGKEAPRKVSTEGKRTFLFCIISWWGVFFRLIHTLRFWGAVRTDRFRKAILGMLYLAENPWTSMQGASG